MGKIVGKFQKKMKILWEYSGKFRNFKKKIAGRTVGYSHG